MQPNAKLVKWHLMPRNRGLRTQENPGGTSGTCEASVPLNFMSTRIGISKHQQRLGMCDIRHYRVGVHVEYNSRSRLATCTESQLDRDWRHTPRCCTTNCSTAFVFASHQYWETEALHGQSSPLANLYLSHKGRCHVVIKGARNASHFTTPTARRRHSCSLPSQPYRGGGEPSVAAGSKVALDGSNICLHVHHPVRAGAGQV